MRLPIDSPLSRGLCLGAALTLLLASGAGATTLRGQIDLPEGGAPAADLPNAVVWFEPDAGARAAPRTVDVLTQNKRFIPRVTPVPVGSTVRFPNHDAIQHNVFSVSPGNRFDLGRYGKGEGRSQRFERPGLVRVYCNVHHGMVSYLLVLDTPHVTRPDATGAFTLEDLPAARGTLHAWHERAGTWSRKVDATAAATPIVVSMRITQAKLPPHPNKHGRPYGDESQDESYR